MAWLRGSPNLARVEADATLNLWLFQFVWLLFGTAAINGLVAERSYHSTVRMAVSAHSAVSSHNRLVRPQPKA